MKLLGQGWRGRVYDAGDGRVLKETTSPTEIAAMTRLRGTAFVPRIDEIGDDRVLREAVTPLSADEIRVLHRKFAKIPRNKGFTSRPAAYSEDAPGGRLGFAQSLRSREARTALEWINDTGHAVAFLPPSPLRDALYQEHLSWWELAADELPRSLPYRELAEWVADSGGVLFDVDLKNMARTPSGRLVLFDAEWAPAGPRANPATRARRLDT